MKKKNKIIKSDPTCCGSCKNYTSEWYKESKCKIDNALIDAFGYCEKYEYVKESGDYK